MDDVVTLGPWQLGQDGAPFTVPEGHYFVMGDNSPHSADSRAWGFVPFGNIKGRVLCVWYPFDRIRGVK
jgi:signal peptidase I